MKHCFILLGILLAFSACNCDEDIINNNTYLHFMTDNESENITIGADVNNIATYSICLSSKPLTKNLEVFYQITIGNGLKEGTDYVLITKASSLIFLPGIYDMPIRVRWLPHNVDSSKDNTMTIALLSNSMGLQMGLPGPNNFLRKIVIEKK